MTGPDTVTLPNIATQLGQALGVGDFGGQVCMGFLFMMIFTLPTLYFCSKYNRDATMPALIVASTSLIVTVPLFGFPSWYILTIFLLIGGLWAGIMRNWITGTGGGK